MLWVRMGIRELFRNKGFSLFFTANLAVGLCGFVAVQSFSQSLNRHLDDNLRHILTADLVVTANAPFTLSEKNLMEQILGPDRQVSKVIRFFTMVQTHDTTRLVQVMAVDEKYPLYGGFVLGPGTDRSAIHKAPGVFMSRDTAMALGIREHPEIQVHADGRNLSRDETGPAAVSGESAVPETSRTLTLGNKGFAMAGFFDDDPDKALTTLELAPKIYVGLNQLADTGLLGFGARVRYHLYCRLPPGTDVSVVTEALRSGFAGLSPDQPRVRVRDSRDVSQNLSRVTGYFAGYMALVSLVALFLAGMAAAFLFRGFLGG
ncbi:MAG: ABC transporter permease, partial [Desulfotignum sp.]